MVTSIVSSRMLEAMSVVEGFEIKGLLDRYDALLGLRCLTHISQGFKHIGNTALKPGCSRGFEVPFWL